MSRPLFVGSESSGRTGGGTFTVPLPAGSSGYLAIVSAMNGDLDTGAIPSGWTLHHAQNSGAENQMRVYVGAGTPGTTWTAQASTNTIAVLVVGYDREITVHNDGYQPGAFPPTSPEISTTEESTVARILTNNSWDSTTPTFNYPSGTSNGSQHYTHSGDTGLGGSHCVYADEPMATPGNTGLVTWSMSDGQIYAPIAGTLALTGEAVADVPVESNTSAVLPSLSVEADASFAVPVEPVDAAASVTLPPLSVAAQATSAVAYPPFATEIDSSGRYFRDQYGSPILIHGDSAWSMAVDLDPTEMETYFTTRASQGFNAAIVSLLGSVSNGGPFDSGSTFDGILPFVADNPLDLNEPYWARIEAMLQHARDNGITVFAFPLDAYVYAASPVDWPSQTVQTCHDFGALLGQRFASYPNVVWVGGADLSDTTADSRLQAVFDGIREHEPAALFSVAFTNPSHSYDRGWSDDINWSFVYSRYPTYSKTLESYNAAQRPTVFGEGQYEGEGTGGDAGVRMPMAWSLTSGACGAFYGHTTVWGFGSGWETALTSSSAIDHLGSIKATLESIPWWDLAPDQGNTLITAGRGSFDGTETNEDLTTDTWATAAITTDGEYAVVYIPSSRTIAIDTSVLNVASVRARWVDPTNGNIQTASSYTTPGLNAGGGEDWLLILDEAEPSSASLFYTEDGTPLTPYRLDGSTLKRLVAMRYTPDPPFITAVDGRFFRDQYGEPILVRGDSPWSMLTDLHETDIDTYFATRASQGFNAAITSLVGHTDNGAPSDDGTTFDGIPPFEGGDITQLNPDYWDRVDHAVRSARANGITLMLYPIDGWNISGVFAGRSEADCQAYGAAVASRLGIHPNIMWMVGGDYIPFAGSDQRFEAVRVGLMSVAPRLFSIQLNFHESFSTENGIWGPRVDWNFCYEYYPTYRAVEDARTASPIPALFAEGGYEGEVPIGTPSVNDETIRRQALWALTSGSPGDVYGSSDWDFNSGWEGRLSTTAVEQLNRIRDLFETWDWWNLVPDTAGDLVTSGRGTHVSADSGVNPLNNAYVTAAYAGTLGVVYIPTARTITVNEALLGGSVAATWWDPTSGATQAAASYTTPGANAAGDGDWLLILDAS